MTTEFPFEAVVFDLDGTLVATDRFWIPAARAGARRAFLELGLERELPSAEEWMSMVGLPLDEGFRIVFRDLADEAREHVFARVVEEEESALRAGGAMLLPGVRETLAELRDAGVHLGVASNCSASYLHTMLADLGLSEWISEGRCLASPGVHSKADMVADLLATFGTQRAVMVGDRAGDCEAAHANGLPHVHVTNGFASVGEGERIPAEAVLDGLSDLVPCLRRRDAWIRSALEAIDLAPDGVGGPRTVGVTGPPLSGKTLFALDAARILRAAGRLVRVAHAEAFVPGEGLAGRVPPERSFAVERLRTELLEPFSESRSGPQGPAPLRGPRGPEVLLVEGPFLHHPRLAARLDRVIYLDVTEDRALARFAARWARTGGATPRDLEVWREGAWSDAQGLARAWPPRRSADLVLDASNPLGPVEAGRDGASPP